MAGRKVGEAFVELTVSDSGFDVKVKQQAEKAGASIEREIGTSAKSAADEIDQKLGSTNTFSKVEKKSASAADEMKAEFREATAKMREDIERLGNTDVSPSFKAGGGGAGQAFMGAFTGALTGDALMQVGQIAADLFMVGWEGAMAEADLAASLQVSLGLTEEAARQAGETASDVWADGWGDSREATAAAVEAILAEFDNLTPDQLEAVTAQAIVMSDAFGTDVASTVAAAGLAYRNGLAPDAMAAMDQIAAGMQEMPVQFRDELLEASNEYGQFFAGLGIEGDAAFNALSKAAEGGIYGIDKTGDAIKELGINATDFEGRGKEAFDILGLNAKEMANQFLAGGDVARGAFDQTIDGLLAIEDPAVQAKAAIALFGAPLEDLGVSKIPAFLQSMDTMDQGLGDVTGTAQEMVDVMGGTMSAQIETFRRQAMQGLADTITNYVLPAIFSFVDWVRVELLPLLMQVYDAWQPAIDGMLVMFGVMLEFIVLAVDQVKNAIELFLAILSGDWSRAWEEIQQIFVGVWDGMILHLQAIIAPIVGFVETIIEWFQHLFDVLVGNSIVPDLINAIVDWFIQMPGRIVGAIVNWINNMIERFARMASTLRREVEQMVNRIVNYLAGLPGRASSALASLASYVGSRIAAMVSTATSRVIGWLSSTVSWIAGLPRRAASALSSLASSVGGVFSRMASTVSSTVSGWINGIVSTVASLPGRMVSALGGLATQVGSAIKAQFKKGVNSAIDQLNQFLPDQVGVGPVKINLPANPLPRWHKYGGIFDTPTVRPEGFGEAGAEAVIPLTMPGRAMELMEQSNLGAMWESYRAGGGGGGNSGGPMIHIDNYYGTDRTDIDLLAQMVFAAKVAA